MTYALDFSSLNQENLRALGEGMVVSLQITATAIVFGVALGTVLAVARGSRVRLLAWLAAGYVTLFRSLPLVIVLLWFFLVIPQLLAEMLKLAPSTDLRMTSALVAFSLFEAAFFSEIVRAGIKSVPRGQLDAAKALGLTGYGAYRYVILPQAFRNMVPLFLTQSIVLFQDTSLVYVSALSDFFGRAALIGERDGRLVELLLFAGFVYFVVCFGLSLIVRRLAPRRPA